MTVMMYVVMRVNPWMARPARYKSATDTIGPLSISADILISRIKKINIKGENRSNTKRRNMEFVFQQQLCLSTSERYSH